MTYSAILYIADEICDESAASDCSGKDVDCIWRTLRHLLSSKMPQLLTMIKDRRTSTTEKRVLLLSALLWYAVLDDCQHKRIYVGRIMSLSQDDQKVLMGLVEKGKDTKSQLPPSTPSRRPRNNGKIPNESGDSRGLRNNPTSAPCSKSLSDDELFASPQENLFFPAATEEQEFTSSPVIGSYLDEMIADLREQNKSLKQELDSTQRREADLGQQLERSVEKFRREMIKLDSASLISAKTTIRRSPG